MGSFAPARANAAAYTGNYDMLAERNAASYLRALTDAAHTAGSS